MPNYLCEKKSQKVNVDFHIEIENISPKDASMLCEYIQNYLVKNYNIITCDYKIVDGE